MKWVADQETHRGSLEVLGEISGDHNASVVRCSCGWQGSSKYFGGAGQANPVTLRAAQAEWDRHVSGLQLLADVRRAWTVEEQASATTRRALVEARQAGAPWSRIADAIGMTPDELRERWGVLV